MSELSLKVHAFWDEEAQVWTASSEDVPGLATEASSLEDLEQKLMIMVPELLELNQVISGDSGQEISIDLISQRISKILVNVWYGKIIYSW
jgi:predicted RNase H-like HicB family nuclease